MGPVRALCVVPLICPNPSSGRHDVRQPGVCVGERVIQLCAFSTASCDGMRLGNRHEVLGPTPHRSSPGTCGAYDGSRSIAHVRGFQSPSTLSFDLIPSRRAYHGVRITQMPCVTTRRRRIQSQFAGHLSGDGCATSLLARGRPHVTIMRHEPGSVPCVMISRGDWTRSVLRRASSRWAPSSARSRRRAWPVMHARRARPRHATAEACPAADERR